MQIRRCDDVSKKVWLWEKQWSGNFSEAKREIGEKKSNFGEEKKNSFFLVADIQLWRKLPTQTFTT